MAVGKCAWFSFQLFPLFAVFPLNLPFIDFNKGNLTFGPERAKEISISKSEVDRTEAEAAESGKSVEHQHYTKDKEDKMSLVPSGKESANVTDTINPQTHTAMSEEDKSLTLSWAWFCVKNYYTAPVNKFLIYMVNILLYFFTSCR